MYSSAKARLGSQKDHATMRYAGGNPPRSAMRIGNCTRSVTAAKISE